MTDKTYTIRDLFTDDEIKRAVELYDKCRNGTFAAECERQVVTPEVMARIDALTGQANNARYMAYTMEFAISNTGVSDAMSKCTATSRFFTEQEAAVDAFISLLAKAKTRAAETLADINKAHAMLDGEHGEAIRNHCKKDRT